ncbi:alpha/beta fold hydrolase [Candidatus Woesearchaeota archaeon]|nr:alpha/beta fold hydrolase [Candidatus Woesearchaeota archaeon]MBI2974284.1 alpha/beta fold hydrolase [Deltaproteobacteria bacterium]
MKNITLIMALITLTIILVSCAYKYPVKTSIDEYKPSPQPREDRKIDAQKSAELIGPVTAEAISLKTKDNKTIFGKYHKTDSHIAVILLHMLDKDHSSWDKFAVQLYLENYSVISIDLRGHGESAKSTGSRQDFTEKDFNNMILDVKEAKEFGLHEKKSKFVIIGASIGANTALNYAAKDNEILGVVLLSPGLDYRGVKTDTSALNYGQRPILLVASEEDTYSANSAKELNTKLFGKKKLVMFKNAGHGTDMFESTELDKEIIAWLKENVS